MEAAVQNQIDKAERNDHGVAHFMEQGYTKQRAEQIVRDRAMSDFSENSHKWLDEGGWRDRIAYMQDNDVIYPVILHIAKTRDRRYLLYDVSVIKNEGTSIDMDATALAALSARAPGPEENGTRSAVKTLEPSEERVTYPEDKVKYKVDMTEIHYSDRIEDLTEEDAYRFIENSNHGEYALDSFVPIRRDTPPLLVELSKKEGLVPLSNLPVIMNVEHIQQCMDDEVAAHDGRKGHALTTDDIINIVKELDTPRFVFFQNDNKRYCEVVEYESGEKGEKAMAIVTYAGNKNPDLMNGYPGAPYNILVTAYPPDAKYWRDYQRSANNILIYDKTKDAPQGSYGSHVPSLLNGSPFATKVTQPKQEVKEKEYGKTSERDSESVSIRNILANAFDGVAQTDEERSNLQKYRKEIASRETEEQKLMQTREKIRQLSFARGLRDKQQLADLREEDQKTENRLNLYDKRLLRLEASKPLMDVLAREK